MLQITIEENIIQWTHTFWVKGMQGMENISKNVVCPMLENYAKLNAPWEDQTGDARRELNSKFKRDSDTALTVSLAHGVDYGIFLERSNAGRFAILEQTVYALLPQIVEEYRKAWKE